MMDEGKEPERESGYPSQRSVFNEAGGRGAIPLRLRPATRADSGAVRALVFGVLAEYGLSPDPAGADLDLMDLEASYIRSGGWFAVIEDVSGTIVGSVGLLPVGEGIMELRKMYLAKGHRGSGLGRRMLEGALEEARRRGIRKVTLETAEVLREAVALYERYGFVRCPEPPNTARCNLVMERELTDLDG